MKYFIFISMIVIIPFAFPYTIVSIIKAFERNNRNEEIKHEAIPDKAPFVNSKSEQSQPEAPERINVHTQSHEALPTSTILFLIGTAFVVLSGIAFGVASWVHTSHLGRVGIILTASLVSFLISLITGKTLKLSGTSIAFYVLGTGFASTSLLTAGFYRLMGNWLSFSGAGKSALLAVTTAVAGLLLFIGYKLIHNKAMMYPAFSASALSILFAAFQIGGDLQYTSIILIILQAVITAYIYMYKRGKTGSPIRIVGTSAAAIYGLAALLYVLISFDAPTFSTFAIMAVIIAQLLAYSAVFKVKAYICAESICALFTAYMISERFYSSLKDDQIIIFSSLAVLIWVIHKFIPFLNTRFTELTTASIAFISSIFCIITSSIDLMIPAIIITSAAALIEISYIFNKSASIRTLAGILSPLLPVLITEKIIEGLNNAQDISERPIINVMCHSILIFVMILFAFILYNLPKISNGFTEKINCENHSALYTNMAVSGILLFTICPLSDYFIISIILCIIHFAVSNKLKFNITSVISSFAFITTAYNHSTKSFSSDTSLIIVMIAVFVLYILISRFVFFDGIIMQKNGRIILDPLILTAWLNIILICKFNRTNSFFVLIATALYFAGFIKKNTSVESKRTLLTFTVIFSSAALLFRPFLIPDSMMISSKINIAIATLTGAALGFIWKSKIAANIMCIISFTALMFDVIYFDNAANTIFGMSVMFAILMLSMLFHSKTWFLASSAALFIVTVYSTRQYLMALNWWIYLFIAGMLLISLAAANEYLRKKGTTFKDMITRKFMTWNW